jgi:alanine dehydrogenase
MSEEKKHIIGDLSQFSLSPVEAPDKIQNKQSHLFIGIPAHESQLEKRIPVTPTGIALLTNNGHRVLIETKAGEGSHYSDHDLSEAGAEICRDKKKVFEADILLNTVPPTEEDLDLMHPDQILISPLQLSTLKHEIIDKLMQKRIIALAFEYLKDDADYFPFVRSMSEIAGNTSILIASEYLSDERHGKSILLGGISGVAPAKVVILGAGVVGEFAARTALGLGASVKIFDDNIYKLMRLQNNIGMRLFTSIIEPEILIRELITADVAIGAIHSESGRTPVIINEEMVMQMKKGSVIIDVSIDQGGCFETSKVTTHENPTYTMHDVIHYCVPNIPSRVSRTASKALSNILSPLLIKADKSGGILRLLHESIGTRHGVYTYKGCLTNHHISEKFGIKFTDVNLLFTATL